MESRIEDLGPYRYLPASGYKWRMVASDITRRVLTGLASALPEEGRNVITRIDIKRGWGDTIQVKIYAGASLEYEPVELRPIFKKAVDDALGQQRHLVDIVWDYHS